MAGRRAQWRLASAQAAVRGETKVSLFGKTGEVSAWLNPEQLLDPKKTLAELQKTVKLTAKANLPPVEPIPPKDTDYKPEGEVCFLIANGESRRNFDLNKLKGKGYTFGMNVLPVVENFWPDALMSVDIATVKWLSEKDVPAKLEHWSYPRGGVKDPRIKRIAKDWGWSSGPTATRVALEYKKFKTLYILGMDFFGITPEGIVDEKKGSKLNNMYKGKERYRKANSDRTYFGNWLNQMVTNTTNHPNANFYHVVLDNQSSPNKLAQKTNWIDINYSKFEEHLQEMAKRAS